jgi:predicted acetyltransferase
MRAYRVSSLEQRREFYTDHPRFGLRDVRVGELDGQIVASLVLYSFTAYVRGQRVPLTGIGSVAVSPEHRRRGIGEALLRSALREARQDGRPWLVLYPFRSSYYSRLGFGTIEIVQELAIAPASLPASAEARFTRRLMVPDRGGVQALFERVASAHGHFALSRTPGWWNRRLWTYPGDWIVYEGRRRGQIEGYLYYETDSSHGPFRLALALNEFVAATPEAHRGLVGYLHALSDQVQEIHVATPGDNGWISLLSTSQNLRPGAEIGLFHDTGNVAHGAMLRATDPKLALESMPSAPGARGELVLEVTDSVLPMNSRAYRVTARDGRFKVTFQTTRRTSRARARTPRLALSAESFGPLVAGTWSPLRATEMGLIESVHGAAEVAETWFRARPAFLYQFNAF